MIFILVGRTGNCGLLLSLVISASAMPIPSNSSLLSLPKGLKGRTANERNEGCDLDAFLEETPIQISKPNAATITAMGTRYLGLNFDLPAATPRDSAS